MQKLTRTIKEQALSLGFDACGICKAEAIDADNQQCFKDWLSNEYHADMDYMAKNADKRLDPRLLVEGAKTIIELALNYYPRKFQKEENPQIAYYAYGKDYHEVMKAKLGALYTFCRSENEAIEGRYFCDTAPVLERYWAAKAGIGWVGKNSMLIIPKKGSYCFIGVLILNMELEYDDVAEKAMPDCGNCTKCMDACPTGAIVASRVIDSRKCLSYQTIENKGEISKEIIDKMGNQYYGCDICQQVCPWNKFAASHSTDEFNLSEELLNLTAEDIKNLDVENYQRIFKGSPMKRAKLSGLKRNIEAWERGKK